MNLYRQLIKVLLLQLLCSTVWAVSVDTRLTTVDKLLNVSSAAKRIQSSGNVDAIGMHAQAIELYQKAEQAVMSGNDKQAQAYLDEATKKLFVATRLIEKDSSMVLKEKKDYEARKKSIDALCEAYDNIRKEKGLGPAESSELFPFVQQRISYAEDLSSQEEFKKGRKVLDEAYVAAKVAIEHLRGGETLVRSLDFETPEDEYEYEIDRNDTHRMLVEVLLREKIEASGSVKKMVGNFMGKAVELRSLADRQAQDGDFEDAIVTLEKSTKEIVRAIRSAGIYIPG